LTPDLPVRSGSSEQIVRKVDSDEVCGALNRGYDDLNKAWAQVEAAVKKFHLRDGASFVYDSAEDDPSQPRGQWNSLLGYVWCRGSRRVCHAIQYEDYMGASSDCPDESSDWKPITECPADVRVKAVPHATKLYTEVLKAASALVPVVERAAQN
jgi:hypothetical protein